MKQLFAILNLIMGIWLLICPWLLGYSGTLAQWGDCAAGLVIVLSSLYVILQKTKPSTPNWPFLTNSILGAWLIISGIFIFGQVSVTNRWNDIILGILVVFFALLASQVIEAKKATLFTKDGAILLEMTNMVYKDGIIVIKGKNFGTMPSIIHIRPVEILNILGLLPLSIIAKLPSLLIAGWRQSKEASKVVKNSK